MIIPPVGYAVQAMNVILFPVNFIVRSTGKFVYDSYFSPAAKFQQSLVQSLATMSDSPEKERCMEEGIKAYQVWIYLMSEGAQEGLFHPAAGG
jgi:hypothetical protein